MSNTQLFKMQIKNNGQWMNFSEIMTLLNVIQKEAQGMKELPLDERTPLLTSESRNVWNEGRDLLIKGMFIKYFENHVLSHVSC